MHWDAETGNAHEVFIITIISKGLKHRDEVNYVGPETKPQSEGPCEGMDCLHGVLMHGDGEPGKAHEVCISTWISVLSTGLKLTV